MLTFLCTLSFFSRGRTTNNRTKKSDYYLQRYDYRSNGPQYPPIFVSKEEPQVLIPQSVLVSYLWENKIAKIILKQMTIECKSLPIKTPVELPEFIYYCFFPQESVIINDIDVYKLYFSKLRVPRQKIIGL